MLVQLLRTKIEPPVLRPALVPRARLIARLAGSPATRLTLVVAPAGFGKTTLVGEWIAPWLRADAAGRGVSWVSLDALDNDPFRFAVHLIAALQTVEPAWGEAVLAMLRGPQLPPAEMVITALVNDLVDQPTPVLLVLDDYHVIRSPWVHAALAFLLDNHPTTFRLALIAREDPPLPLSRLRVRGQLIEVRADDLRFTLDEALAFLNQTMGLALSEQAIAELEARTEGWVAGLQLAALALHEHHDAEAFVRAFTGNQRYVIDYLVDEVLRVQPPPVRAFLTQTSILARFCAPLCEAVVQLDPGDGAPQTPRDARAMLNYLDRANLFLVSLDDERRWYRYHHLFADSLQADLDPDQLASLHRRAAGWLRDNGLLPEAIQHALAARDHTLAADLLAEGGRDASIWQDADYRPYLAWVEMLPPTALEGRPRLLLCYARALYLYGRLADAEAVLTAAEAQLASAPLPDQELLAVAAVYRAQWALEHGDYQETKRLAEYALEHIGPTGELDRARAYYALASAHYAQGHAAAAQAHFQQAGHLAQRSGALTLALSSYECAARCLALQGQFDAARQAAEQILALGQLGRNHHPLIIGALLTLAEAAYQHNELDAVEPLIRRAIALSEPMGALVRAHQCWAYQQLARLHHARHDLAAAAQASQQADEVAHAVNNPFFLLASAARQRARDAVLGEALPMRPPERIFMPVLFFALDEYAALAEAWQLISRQRAGEALPVLDALLEAAARDGRLLIVIELHLWRAVALQALHRERAALEALGEAMALAAPEKCLRPFLDLGPVIGGLLRLAAHEGVGGDFARALAAALVVPSPEQPRDRAPLPPSVPGRETRGCPPRPPQRARAAGAALDRGRSLQQRDRRPALHRCGHRQVVCHQHLQQAGRQLARPGRRSRPRIGAARLAARPCAWFHGRGLTGPSRPHFPHPLDDPNLTFDRGQPDLRSATLWA